MVATAESKSERILKRVRALLARAEHANTPAEEAEVALQQANKLMVQYAIDEALLRATQSEAERRKPVSKVFTVGNYEEWEFVVYLRTIFEEIARTNRCRAVATKEYEYTVVGFSEDVSWVEMLYMNCYVAFVTNLRPTWKGDRSYDENVYNFKVAGYKWIEINRISMAHGGPDARLLETRYNYHTGQYEKMPSDKKISGSMISAYKRHAREIGDTNPVATQNFQSYRLSYADGFASQIARRLEQMRQDASEAVISNGAELVLRDAMHDIEDFFYDMFPYMRPLTEEQRAAVREAARARKEAEQKARDEMLAAMTPSQRARFLEKEERDKRRQAERDAKYWRETHVDRDYSATARGRSAADTVNLNRAEQAGAAQTRKELN